MTALSLLGCLTSQRARLVQNETLLTLRHAQDHVNFSLTDYGMFHNLAVEVNIGGLNGR